MNLGSGPISSTAASSWMPWGQAPLKVLLRATAEPQRGLNHTKTQPRVSELLQNGFGVVKPESGSHYSCDERFAK